MLLFYSITIIIFMFTSVLKEIKKNVYYIYIQLIYDICHIWGIKFVYSYNTDELSGKFCEYRLSIQ